MGLLIFYNSPTCLCLNSTMSTYDYVYLIIEAMSSMTLLSQYLHIHFQFIILFISSNLNSILFLKTNEIYLFLNIEGRFLLFVFPLASHLQIVGSLWVCLLRYFFTRLSCHLLRCVAFVSLIIPLCSHYLLSTSSPRIVQSTGAFTFSIAFYWPTCSSGPYFWFFFASSCSSM